MLNPFIPLLLGTGREGRQSEKVARYLFEILNEQPVDTEFLDVRDLMPTYTVHHSTDDPKTRRWKEIADRADGFVVVFPEYNHSYPGEMKMVLDSAMPQYLAKPLMMCSVSNGGFGGVRAIEHMVSLAHDLKMVVLPHVLMPSLRPPATTAVLHGGREVLAMVCPPVNLH